MIIGAYEKSDRPAGEIQTLMAQSGLGALTMPLSIADGLKSAVVKHGNVGRCEWSWGVHCHVDVQWTNRPPEKWGAACVKGKEALAQVLLKAVIVPTEAGGRGEVQIDGIQACWAAGGESVRLLATEGVQTSSSSTPSPQ